MGERTTARWAIPFPTETGGVKVGNVDLQELAERLDEILYPPGDLRFTAKATLDSGWLKCEGQAVSRSTFKALFEAIGTAYGAGDGSTTFNVPNYVERVAMGPGGTNAVGAKLGEAAHKLIVSELASHIHSTPNHTHPAGTGKDFVTCKEFGEEDQAAGWNGDAHPAIGLIPNPMSKEVNTGLGGENTTGAAGGAEGHNNVQPSTVCNVWIKT